MRRVVTIIIVVVVLAGGGYLVYRQQQARQNQEVEILREATVERGKLAATVSATGSIEPEAMVSLSFGVAGTVRQLNVVRGQAVAAGDVLATLDTEELALAVQQAEDALRIQQLTLEQLLNAGPSPATLAAAQADSDAAAGNLLVAQANLSAAEAAVAQAVAQKALLQAGPTPGQVAAAEANVATARLEQQNAEELHNRTLECFDVTLPSGEEREQCPGLGEPEEQARAALENANSALAAAEAQLADVLAGARPADVQVANATIAAAQAQVAAAEGNVAVAEANVARAQAAYDRLLEGPTDEEIAILEAQVAAAGTNLALAQLRLEQSIIVAPMDGTVANILANAGEQVAPGAPAVAVVNETGYHIEVNVDEIDIDRVA
ncbi:MAG: biotin/lipoyl-binding protein, partial [Chloroflexi bacterium]|nr:biotin/lipoyl-binding protein [Chloroflexota bacterium]